jgi:hypothetical protein
MTAPIIRKARSFISESTNTTLRSAFRATRIFNLTCILKVMCIKAMCIEETR